MLTTQNEIHHDPLIRVKVTPEQQNRSLLLPLDCHALRTLNDITY